jgi:transposase InsO family protein
MSYSNNPYLPRARALGVKLLINEGLPLNVVARKCGVHRSTIYRWKQKWLEINANVQLENFNRPSRDAGKNTFRLAALKWLIPTLSSKPKISPNAISESVVERILELRRILKRCAEVIWYHLTHEDGIRVSLSSVRRILRRHHYVKGRKPRLRRDNPIRPNVTKPGQLIQADTIHYVCPYTKRRRYVYTLIDLHTRMTYAEIHSSIRPGIASSVVLRAESIFGFNFAMVQTDNGPEYCRYFEDKLTRVGILVRHSRLHRPNDNAFIERFNRTIQDECLGRYLDYRTSNAQVQTKLNKYLEFYNTKRVHLSLQYRTPQEMLQSS